VGAATIATFIATGICLKFWGTELFGSNETMRFIYRANHVYIMFAGILNVAVGVYLCPHAKGWRRNLQVAGSVMLLIAPVLLILAYIREPRLATHVRPFTAAGVMLLLVGTLCHVPARK
jgi:hypothetical protein